MCKRIEFKNVGWSDNSGHDALYIKFTYDMFASSNGGFRRPVVDKYMCSSDSEEFIEFEINHDTALKLKESIEKYLEEKLFYDLRKKDNTNEN
jgi:hypothetical protein